MTDCDYCDRTILENEVAYRVLCLNHKDCNIKVYYYCEKCFRELSFEYKKRYGESAIIEQ